MATIDDLNRWCLEARELLSRRNSEGPKALTANTEGVVKLLGVMQADVMTFGDDYPGFRTRFNELGNLAKQVNDEVGKKQLTKSEGKSRIQQVSRDLRQLQLRLEVRIAQLDPTRSPESSQRSVQMSRHKPVYENKCKRVQEAADELVQLPGTKKQVLALLGLLNAAKQLEPDYEKAYQALDGLSGNLKDGREAAARFGKGAGDKELEKVLLTLNQAIDNYDAVGGTGNPNRVTAERDAINRALLNIDMAPDGARSKLIGNARVDLKNRGVQLDSDRQALLREDGAVKLLHDRLNPLASTLRGIAAAEVATPLLTRFNAAQALWSTQQFVRAKEEFTKVDKDLTTCHGSCDKAHKAWQAIDLKLTDGLKTVEQIAVTPQAGPLSQPAQALAGSVRLLRSGKINAHDFAGAVKDAGDLKLVEEFAALKQMLADAQAGKTVTLKFGSRALLIQAALSRIEPPLEQAGAAALQAIEALEKAGGSGVELRREHGGLLNAVALLRTPLLAPAPAPDAPLPDLKPMESAVKQAIDALTRLADKARGVVDDPALLKQSQATRTNENAGQDFERARAAARQALDYLDGFDAPDNHPVMVADPDVAGLKTRYDALLDRAKQNDFATDAMDKLASDAVNKRQLILNALEQRRGANAEGVTALTKQIGVLRKARSANAPYFDSLLDRLTGLAAMAGSTVLSVMDDGEGKLALFKTEVQSLADAKGDTGKVNYALVDKTQSELKRLLDDKEMKTWQPVAQARLLTQLKEVLPKQLEALSPAQAMAELNKLMDEVVQARDRITAAKQEFDKLKIEAGQQRQKLEALKTSAPGLYADLSKRLDGLLAAPASEVVSSASALKTVRVLIASAADPARRGKLEKKAQVDLLRAQQDKADFEAAVDVFKKDLQREAKEVYDSFGLYDADRNSELYGQIAARLKDAETEGSKGSPVVAMGKLRVAEAAARAFMATPLVPAAAARKAVLAASKNWQTAVGRFAKDVIDLKNTIRNECDKDRMPKEQTTTTIDALEPLGLLFNAATFESATRQLSEKDKNPTEDAPKRRVAKENALVIVRRYQRLLDEHRLIAAVTDNPFKPVSTATMRQALAGLNGALQAS